MKILIFNTLYSPYKIGGAERSVQLLSEALCANGHDVCVASLHEGSVIKDDSVNGVRVVRFPIKNLYWPFNNCHSVFKKILWHLIDIYNVSSRNQINKYFANERFDLVHTNNLSGFSVSVWSWARAKKIPIVHTCRDYYLLDPNATLFRKGENVTARSLFRMGFSVIKKMLAKKVSSFVAISHYVQRVHVKNGYFETSKKYVIYNSIVAQNEQLKKQKTTDEIAFGYLGRVEPGKGIEFILKHLNKNKNFKYILIIAGKGDEKYIEYLKSEYKNVNMKFLGVVDINSFFPNIEYLIVPSLWNEPMGRVVLEANSFGVPVIGSNRGGIPEIINENETGYIFDVNAYDAFDNILKIVWKTTSFEYEEMSRKAIIHSSKFTEDSVVRLYQSVYEDTLNMNKEII
ncbi:glycosyltransferase involved in cell wall biosynthesis [Raoultella sp. BIGb0149]|uniref:glycosyltransferase family 4 protein n=1 Tax=Raoultella sp. BIGb0149 TaxID=2485116 RepID=UPI00105C0208|nr:glycosyltransferase family 4 protein [Raoultella sp. BIGb0149]TDQ24895.1 glycosyltransferase involved in cell wall biosynthesis [Raoultella sp. BIGb0149]